MLFFVTAGSVVRFVSAMQQENSLFTGVLWIVFEVDLCQKNVIFKNAFGYIFYTNFLYSQKFEHFGLYISRLGPQSNCIYVLHAPAII